VFFVFSGRACSAIRRVAMNIARVSAFTVGGQLDVDHQWPLYLGMLGSAACGLLIGVSAEAIHQVFVMCRSCSTDCL
jgi:uncharacterized integral membrane protein